jgi:alkylation response protein AidB-like acyl-CoA dehydrogenase
MSIRYEDMREAIGSNFYAVDPNLGFEMDRAIEATDRSWAEGKLVQMGELIGGPIAKNAEVTDKHPAELVRWNREGDEICEVVHHPSALETKRLLWKNDFLHLPWSAEVRERGRPVPPALIVAYHYLLSQAETGMLCSVGMTTGVLRLVERYGDPATRALFAPRLLDNDFDRGWDGSMYLTERAGGSDLGTTETTARLVEGVWKLDGLKWFCSNIDGDAFVTLARPEGAPEGIKGVALFVVARRNPDGSSNGVHMRRIKDKLGTRAVPTGEIELSNTTAYLLAGGAGASDGRGINRMMEFVNESRLAVAAMGAGIMRRVFLEATIRAHRRRAFGKLLAEHGMVREQLLDLLVESEAAAALLFGAASRVTPAFAPIGEGNVLPRILVPLAKIRCTRGGVTSASLALEIFGGNGYIEDWPMARQLRDAQCHTIWEGAENVLALDILRSMARNQTHEPLLELLRGAVERAHPALANLARTLGRANAELVESLGRLASVGQEAARLHARKLASDMADATQAALLLDQASIELGERGSARKALVAAWFIRSHLEPRGRWHAGNQAIALELFEPLIRYEQVTLERAKVAL